MILDQLPALQVVIPLLGSVIVALMRRGNAAWVVSLIVCWITSAIAFLLLGEVLAGDSISYALGGWEPPFGIEYRVDRASAFLLVLVSLMGALVMTYAPRSLASEIAAHKLPWYYAMYLICLAGLLGMAITGDAFNIFVFMEISSLATYVMIALGRDKRALVSAFQYLIVGTMGATFFVIGVGLLFVLTGSLNLVDVAARLDPVEDSRAAIAAMAFLTVGIGLKLALFPLHLWLPNAYAFAPSVATAFLSSTATKVAVYLLLRIMFSVFGLSVVFGDYRAAGILFVLSVLAMLIPSIVAIFQANVKRMLAYSSVAQIGYITLGIALANQTGLTGGIAHIFNHAIIKACLFLAIGCMFYSTGITKVADMAGLGRRMPLTMAAFVIAGLGLIGVPGTAGFVSKWYLIAGALERDMWWLAAVIVVSSIIAVLYIGRIVEVAWFRKPPPTLTDIKPVPAEMMAITWVLAIATIFFGFFTGLTAGVAGQAAQVLLAGYS